ncbi:MAG TPA: hypothetical protein VHM24_00345 [Gemmatimonadaceae bacterium]|nr:hypothetical protein [Gemmatimonadaceae bacterium]
MPSVDSEIDRAEAILIRQCSLTIGGLAPLSSAESAVRNLAALMRGADIPPERVVTRIKNAAARSGCGPLQTGLMRYRDGESASLVTKLVSWAIDAYFAEPEPLDTIGRFSMNDWDLLAAELRLVAEACGELDSPAGPKLASNDG